MFEIENAMMLNIEHLANIYFNTFLFYNNLLSIKKKKNGTYTINTEPREFKITLNFETGEVSRILEKFQTKEQR